MYLVLLLSAVYQKYKFITKIVSFCHEVALSINHFNFLNVRTFTYPELIKPDSANFSRRAEFCHN